jgi:hypothetical protein
MSDAIYFQFTRYSQPLLIVFGTIGAIFNQILFFYRPPLRRSSCSLYFRAISANDLLVLYTVVLPLWLGNQFQIDPSQQSNWYCKFKTYLTDSLYTLSPYLLVLACFDRLCTSSTNPHIRRIATVRAATYLIPAMVIFIFGIYSHVPIYYQVIPYLSLSYCAVWSIAYSKFLGFFILFILSIIPPILMVILCSITIALLRQRRRRVMPVNQSRLRQRDNQLLKMLFIYVAFNVICSLPFTFTYVMLMLEQPNYVPQHVTLFRLFALLLNVNFSTSFYAYTLGTPFYRHELYNLIGDFKTKLWQINYLHSTHRTTHVSGVTG